MFPSIESWIRHEDDHDAYAMLMLVHMLPIVGVVDAMAATMQTADRVSLDVLVVVFFLVLFLHQAMSFYIVSSNNRIWFLACLAAIAISVATSSAVAVGCISVVMIRMVPLYVFVYEPFMSLWHVLPEAPRSRVWVEIRGEGWHATAPDAAAPDATPGSKAVVDPEAAGPAAVAAAPAPTGTSRMEPAVSCKAPAELEDEAHATAMHGTQGAANERAGRLSSVDDTDGNFRDIERPKTEPPNVRTVEQRILARALRSKFTMPRADSG
jgi:hypothetical protein